MTPHCPPWSFSPFKFLYLYSLFFSLFFSISFNLIFSFFFFFFFSVLLLFILWLARLTENPRQMLKPPSPFPLLLLLLFLLFLLLLPFRFHCGVRPPQFPSNQRNEVTFSVNVFLETLDPPFHPPPTLHPPSTRRIITFSWLGAPE